MRLVSVRSWVLSPLGLSRQLFVDKKNWDLNPGPSACEADVMPLHHVPHAGIFIVHTHSVIRHRATALTQCHWCASSSAGMGANSGRCPQSTSPWVMSPPRQLQRHRAAEGLARLVMLPTEGQARAVAIEPGSCVDGAEAPSTGPPGRGPHPTSRGQHLRKRGPGPRTAMGSPQHHKMRMNSVDWRCAGVRCSLWRAWRPPFYFLHQWISGHMRR